MMQSGMLHWVLRVEHLSQHQGRLPFDSSQQQCSAVECDTSGGVLVGCQDGTVWHVPVCCLQTAVTSASAVDCKDSSCKLPVVLV